MSVLCDRRPMNVQQKDHDLEAMTRRKHDNRNHQRGYPKSLAISSGEVKDMGDNGGYSPSATASSCANGGREPGRVFDVVIGG